MVDGSTNRLENQARGMTDETKQVDMPDSERKVMHAHRYRHRQKHIVQGN